MNSLALTEKQQEVVWLRYDRQASIDQIAQWLHISRRAVLARLRNARRRTAGTNLELPLRRTRQNHAAHGRPVSLPNLRQREYPASQLARDSAADAVQLDDL